MENTTNLNKNRPLFEKIARAFFLIYMITIYVFVDNIETVVISRIVFVLYAGFTALALLYRKRFHIGANVMLVYFTITWMYATSFWAYNIYWASFKMNTVWQVFVLFFLTYNLFAEDEDAHEYLLKSLYIAGISLLIYSIYTYGFTRVIVMMTSPGGVRLGREISQENTFGMYNAITLIISFYYLFYKKRYKLFHVAIVALSFIFTMSSGSRKALLMICIGVLYIVYRKYGFKKLYKLVIITALLVALFLMVIKLPMFELINTRLELAMETLKGDGAGDSSANTRYKMIIDGWNVFKERLLIGYGADNYALVTRYRTYSHNNFIEMLVDFGLIGFVLYYLAYVFAVNNLSKSKKDASKALSAIFLVRLLMEVALVTYYSKQQWILLAFFLISDKACRSHKKKKHVDVINRPSDPPQELVTPFAKKEDDNYEPDHNDEEIEESDTQSEDYTPDISVAGEYCEALPRQDIFENEVLGSNGEEAQS